MGSPARTCKSCGRKVSKEFLQRYVWGEEKPLLDEAKRMDGRGAYCCTKEKCVSRFLKQKKKWKICFRL